MKKFRSLFVTFLLVFVTLFAGCQGNFNVYLNDTSGNSVINVDGNVDQSGYVKVDITGSAVENTNKTETNPEENVDINDSIDASVTEDNQTIDSDNKEDEINIDLSEIIGKDVTIEENIDDNQELILTNEAIVVVEDGEYSDKEHVALYIHTFNHLPSNFITKKEAKELGWESSKGNLGTVAPGKSIGGDRFGNREGILPAKDGRKYYECDIDYQGKKRGAKRIVFSDDGLIYYTEDHYETFELLYE